MGSYYCGCPRRSALFSVDALRIHEGMNPVGSNGAMYAEIMQVVERLWINSCLENHGDKRMVMDA